MAQFYHRSTHILKTVLGTDNVSKLTNVHLLNILMHSTPATPDIDCNLSHAFRNMCKL